MKQRHIHPAETKLICVERFVQDWPRAHLTTAWRAYILDACTQVEVWISDLRAFAAKNPLNRPAPILNERADGLQTRVDQVKAWMNEH